MQTEKALWGSQLNLLRELLTKTDRFDQAIELCLELHAMVHLAEMSGIDRQTFEDELWNGLDEETFKTALNQKGRTIAYGVWHSTRIEDITMNILVAGQEQVINTDNWLERMNAKICDTGNAMSTEEILTFSEYINMHELRNYRIEVGRKTREIIKGLVPGDFKRKMESARLQRVLDEGGVLDVEAARWLIDFWGKKTVAGILLMPALRHHVVHISESMSAKKKGKALRKKSRK